MTGEKNEACELYERAVKQASGDSYVRDDPEWRRLRSETAALLGLPPADEK